MRELIRNFLNDNEFEFEENVLRITVDCGGQVYNYLKLIQLISENIEAFTYDDAAMEESVRIEIDCANETVNFNL